MEPMLRLTEEERQWNDYQDTPGKRGVIPVRYPGLVTLTPTQRTAIVALDHTRRSRVYKFTWSGDVAAMRVRIYDSRGQALTIDSCHIPSLSGHTPLSTLSTIGGNYPDNVATPFALQMRPAWEFVIDPNLVLPGGVQLLAEYTLENPADPTLAKAINLRVQQVVHCWEFPGFDGGA